MHTLIFSGNSGNHVPEGRTALVTGFGGCIGSAIAVSLAEAGFGVVGTDRSLSDSVKQNMEKIRKM